MQVFDVDFGEVAKTRLAALPEDASPQWGTMNRGQLYGHLDNAVRYTLGENPEMPFRGNFKTRHIFRHVILYGLKEIPHGIKLPRPEGVTEAQLFPEIAFEVLGATIDRYLDALGKGNLPARTHPFFGPLSSAKWQRFHRLHFIHHMKQFDLVSGL